LSSIIASGYAGTNGATGATGPTGPSGGTGATGNQGASSRICYSKTTLSSLDTTPTTITTSGSASFPPNNSWGTGTVWVAQPPTITAGESVYQSDGIYDPVTGNTVWNVPYLSALKVGSLSAITANTGNLTVSGTIQSNTGAISGTTMTGSGAVIYSSGNFAVGNSTNNITYNGSAITLNGTVVFPANINSNNLTLKDGSGNVILGNGTPLNFANITPASGWLNNNISVSGGAISGIGTGTGTVVANDQIYISSGSLFGIGSGAGTAVANNAISINSNGTLSGAGGGAVTPNGINAVNTNLSNAPAGILNSNVSLGTLGAGAFAYINAITTANVSTYINSAAIGTAQIGVLAAGNIGANTIDASKIAANTITAGQIAANTITADRMSVSTLSAITANLGTITAGSISGSSLSVGSSPAVSGTTMTGAGAKINTDGTFALGNSSTNITYNGSAMYLNGNVVATNNINANAVTISASAFTAGESRNTALGVWQDIQSVVITTSGQRVYISSCAIPLVGIYIDTEGGNSAIYPIFRLARDSNELLRSDQGSMSFSETPSAGTYTYSLQCFTTNPGAVYYVEPLAGGSNRSLFVMETKR
jgi:hypothetical protein